MNRIRIKHKGEKMGTVQTILKSDQRTRSVTSLTGNELAQLIVDVWTLPQIKPADGKSSDIDGKPGLRPGEDRNLMKLLFTTGQARYGEMFTHVIAERYMRSLS